MNNLDSLIEDSYDKSNNIIVTCKGEIGNLNTYAISDEIIKQTGRFCEHYQSDCIITINSMNKLCSEPVTKDTTNIICFGIRTNGVDDNDFIQSRIESKYQALNRYLTNEWAELYYHRILAVKITRKPDKSITCELKQIKIQVTDDKPY